MDHGADPAALEGQAIVAAAQAGRLAVAEALLAGCCRGAQAVGGLALLPLLQDAVSSPALPPMWQAPIDSPAIQGLRWLLAQMPTDHVCARRLVFSGLEGLWLGEAGGHAVLVGVFSSLSQRMRQATLERTSELLALLVEAGAPPVAVQREGVPGLSPRAWVALRPAATAWPDGGWSRAAHRRYHRAFRAAARELLLVAHRGFALPTPGQASAKGQIVGDGGSSMHGARSSRGSDGNTPQKAHDARCTCYHLPPLAVERAISLAAERQSDWVAAC
ncbi:hypothetical protein ABPG75_001530 [Micractinium tetrahymenae]